VSNQFSAKEEWVNNLMEDLGNYSEYLTARDMAENTISYDENDFKRMMNQNILNSKYFKGLGARKVKKEEFAEWHFNTVPQIPHEVIEEERKSPSLNDLLG